jgi:hypothetical protein
MNTFKFLARVLTNLQTTFLHFKKYNLLNMQTIPSTGLFGNNLLKILLMKKKFQTPFMCQMARGRGGVKTWVGLCEMVCV